MRILLVLILVPSLLFPTNQFVQEHELYTDISRQTAIGFSLFCVAGFIKGVTILPVLPTKFLQQRRLEQCCKNANEVLRLYQQEAQAGRLDNAAFIEGLDRLANVDLYARLELNEFATDEQITNAYRQLNRTRHINRLQQNWQRQRNNDEITQEQFVSHLNQAKQATTERHEAQQILTNPVQRRLYNTMRANPEAIHEAQRVIDHEKTQHAERERLRERVEELLRQHYNRS